MPWFSALFNHIGYGIIEDTHTRQYRLIRYITVELVIVCLTVACLYTIPRLWYLVAVISLGGILALANLGFLSYTRNTQLCGHILIFITFCTILVANYLVRGVGTSYSLWFYVIPLFAASLTGWRGLLIYSFFSLLMIISAGILNIHPFYSLTAHQLYVIDWANRLFAYLIIVTTLSSLIRENSQYEQVLNEKSHVLEIEKNKYQYLARVDKLTNLPNREYFKQHLQEIMDSLAPNYCVTLFFMDLDHFKEINDFYGHNAGDLLLLQASRRLQQCFRQGDFIARLGGDEFTAIVLHAQDHTIAQVIAQKIIQAFEKPFTIEDQEQYCSISIGLSTCPHDSQIVSELMHKADLAMYVAKKQKGSSYYKTANSLAN